MLPVSFILDAKTQDIPYNISKKCIFCLYCSPSEEEDVIRYLIQTVEHLNSEYPYSKIKIFGDFTLHNEAWLKSNTTSTEGHGMEAFVSPGLSQIVSKQAIFPRAAESSRSNFDLFLTNDPQRYTVDICVSSG